MWWCLSPRSRRSWQRDGACVVLQQNRRPPSKGIMPDSDRKPRKVKTRTQGGTAWNLLGHRRHGASEMFGSRSATKTPRLHTYCRFPLARSRSATASIPAPPNIQRAATKYRKALGSAIARPSHAIPTASHRQATQILGRPKSDLVSVRRSPESSSGMNLTLRRDPIHGGAAQRRPECGSADGSGMASRTLIVLRRTLL